MPGAFTDVRHSAAKSIICCSKLLSMANGCELFEFKAWRRGSPGLPTSEEHSY